MKVRQIYAPILYLKKKVGAVKGSYQLWGLSGVGGSATPPAPLLPTFMCIDTIRKRQNNFIP